MDKILTDVRTSRESLARDNGSLDLAHHALVAQMGNDVKTID
jgi:hypothetical protein